MTTKQMEAINRRTRVIQRIKKGDCLYKIAADEKVGQKHVYNIAREEHLKHCNHLNKGYKCELALDSQTQVG